MRTERLMRLIDAHAGGDVSRVIVEGAPRLHGDTVAAQCRDFATRYDHWRRLLTERPRGATHQCPVLLLPPCDPSAELGLIIMESIGYPPISGTNLFCAVTVALELGLVGMRELGRGLRVETPIGVVPVSAVYVEGRCQSVEFENVPARSLREFYALVVPGVGEVCCAVASAGIVTVVVAAADAGVSLDTDGDQRIAEVGARISRAAGERLQAEGGAGVPPRIDFTLFYDSLRLDDTMASCRAAMFQHPDIICRSPTGTGASALYLILHTRRHLPPKTHLFVRARGGGEFRVRTLGTTLSPDGQTALRTAVAGRAWVTGCTDIFADPEDPSVALLLKGEAHRKGGTSAGTVHGIEPLHADM